MLKKLALIMTLTVGLAPTALADQIDFSFANGTWSWGGSGALTGSNSGVTGTVIPGGATQGDLDISFSSGAFIGGDGSGGNPFTWGSGGFIDIGNGSSGLGCAVTCLSGVFTSSQLAFLGGNTLVFNGLFVAGSVDQALLAALGLPSTDTAFTGSITLLLFTTGGCLTDGGATCSISSGDFGVTTTPVPEPGSLMLLGTGMVSLAGALRRRLRA